MALPVSKTYVPAQVCPKGGTHVTQKIVVKAFHDFPSRECYKCGLTVHN